MSDIRRIITQRMRDLGLSGAEVSRQLGMNRGFLSDFLNTPGAELKYEVRLRMAELLHIPPGDLGVMPILARPNGGLHEEEAEPYVPPTNSILRVESHIAYFRMKGRGLDQHPRRIKPGDLLAFDLDQVSSSAIADGSIVIAQRFDKRDLTRSHGTVIRQFIAPNKLVTNSSLANEIESIDDDTLPYEIVIRGVLLAVVDEVRAVA